ncbi:MAG: hypothetical protein CEN91_296 [Candidatus Berkelbacteria bacterium Licking1014_85]|uniref:Tetratricopeptide repeat protein n=1 Tax=Candidatus Berkelbacteria bacterium Licking1014_85 TaxID=2017148 RepID=A0A554LJT0_9BACT|nr:MAG: hypothetical protein CEN91_296 [Candidatus Berkelbacteria bacterium Licking1014_85]
MIQEKASNKKAILFIALIVLFLIYKNLTSQKPIGEQNTINIQPPELYQADKTSDETQALLNENKNAEELAWIAKDKIENDKIADAIAILETAVQSDPKYRDGFYLLGYGYLKNIEKNGLEIDKNNQKIDESNYVIQLTDLDKAEIALASAKRIDPIDGKIYELLAIVADLKGDTPLAENYEKKAEEFKI